MLHNIMIIAELFPDKCIHIDDETDDDKEDGDDEVTLVCQEFNDTESKDTDKRRQTLYNYMCLMFC